VAPYSVRAHPGATVSTPLRWDEVSAGLSPSRFDITSVPDRVAAHGDPMHDLLSAAPDLDRAIAKLGRMLER
jgi:bifunctional non-homologous end joining protein LigD